MVLTPNAAKDVQALPDGGDRLRGKHPIGRFGEVSEVAEAAVFLCSDESRFLTGANVPIDGAYSRV
jgi:NAD(P)-dependent dehydrogenase (short-subunit alcohol dehydrogenase family)